MTEQKPARPTKRGSIIALAGMAAVSAIIVPALAAKNSGPATPPPSTWAYTEPIPTPTLEDTAAPTVFTTEELAYLRALNDEFDYNPYDDDIEAVNAGHELCNEGKPTIDEIADDTSDVPYGPAIKHLCPKYLPLLRKAKDAISDGEYTVGEDMKPGTYKTTPGRISDCYWERSTGGGDIIANNFINNAPRGVTVTVRAGEGFTSQGCGYWIRS